MIRILYVLSLISIATVYGNFNQDTDWNSATSLYDFHARDLYGNDIPLDKYRDHVVVIFSGATRCPVSAKNFKLLHAMQEKYAADGLKIVTFIVDGVKNSGTPTEIQEYIKSINTPLDVYEKIIYEGDDAHPVYKWLKSHFQEKIFPNTKILIDKQGKIVAKYPATGPLTELEDAIKQYL